MEGPICSRLIPHVCGDVPEAFGCRQRERQRCDRTRLELVENDCHKSFGAEAARIRARYFQKRQD
jgi:hypothetical protein